MQLAQRSRVERAGLHARDAEPAQTGAHLAGGARREGQREHALRLLGTRVDGIRDAVRDGAGLARARTREDAERAGRRECDLSLLGVEPLEDLVGGGGGQERSPFAMASARAAWSGTWFWDSWGGRS
ncbi:hypothetical protein GCM10028802_17300 [Terrabacter terrigena]